MAISANSKGSADDLRDALWFVVHLLFGDADHIESACSQIEDTGAIVLERGAAAVVVIAIGFDDQSRVAPEEIDEVRPHANVHLRSRQAVATTQPQEVALQVTAGAIALLVVAKRDPQSSASAS